MDSLALRAFISVCLIMVPAIGFGIAGMRGVMALAIVAGGLAAAFVNFDQISKIRALSFGLERVERATKNAEEATEELRRVARPLFLASMANLAWGNRFDGIPIRQQHEIVREIEAAAPVLHMQNDPELQDLVNDFYGLQQFDRLNRLRHYVERNKDREEASRQSISGRIDQLNRNHSSPATEGQIRGAFGGEPLLPTEERLLDYYLYYVQNRALAPGDDGQHRVE